MLEGIGAALVLPALVALTARSFEGPARALAYGVLGGVSGAGIAVGPILGGWVTTNLTWRIVFVGEVLVVIGILLAVRLLPKDRGQAGAELDRVGAVLCALGLALVVFGVLQASTWGWLQPRNSPIEPFGFSLTPFVIAAGLAVIGGFRAWERRRERLKEQPLVHFRLLSISGDAQRAEHVPVPEPDPDGRVLRDPAVPAGRAGLRRVSDGRQDAAGVGHAVRDRA